MDPEYVASWFVGVSATLTILRHLRTYRFRHPGMLVVNALALGALVVGELLDLAATGWVALGLWSLLAVAPLLGARRTNRLLLAQRIDEAANWARWVAWLHPFGGNPHLARYLHARADALDGRIDDARAGLRPLLDTKGTGELAQLELLRLDRDWAGIVRHVEAQPIGTRDLALLPIYLIALGEMGRVEAMIDVYASTSPAVRSVPTIRLTCLAFAGRPRAVAALFDEAIAETPEDIRRYWIACARQAAGQQPEARNELEQLARGHGPARTLAEQRLASALGPVSPNDLSERARAALGAMEALTARMRQLAAAPPRRPNATLALMAVLCVVFLVGALDGTTDLANLVSMGALVLPPELVDGEMTWRVITAGFLHFGATHLFMNLAGLWLLGGELERAWGALRTALVFVAATIGAYASAPWLITATAHRPQVLLGASAGVMGLVGALGVFSAVGFFYGRDPRLRGRLQAIGIIVAVQIAFDWSTPIVASALHAAGFVVGALASAPLALAHWRPARRRSGA